MKKIIQILIFLLLATQLCFAQGFWSKVGDMPEIRYGHTVDELNGKIYVVGGAHTETSEGPRTALVYDLASKEWSQIPLCNNKGRGAHSSCIVDGKLYVMGGNDGLGSVATMDMFDPGTGEWTSKKPMSIDRGLAACAAIDDKIYIMGGLQAVGGNTDYTGLSTIEVYDTKNDTWTKLKDMPRKRWGLSAVAFNDKIYVFGGTAGPAATVYSSVDVYDPQTNTWNTPKTNMPTARYCLTTCVLDSNIYTIGGWRNSAVGPIYDKVEVYNPQTNEWKTEKPLPVKRAVLASLALDGRIYVYGGAQTTHPNKGTSAIYELTYNDIIAKQPYVDKTYVLKNMDSVLFLTRFSNIYNHAFTPYLICVNSNGTVTDSLLLYDDGLHGDSLMNDGLYGEYIPPRQTEDFFILSTSTIDNQTNRYYKTPDRYRFTTAGPVVLDSVSIKKSATYYDVKAYFKNNSEIATIKKPTIKIICNDPWVLPTLSETKNLLDILPGNIGTYGNTVQINYIDSIFPGYFNLKFEISSNGYHYWTDTLRLNAVVTGVKPDLQEITFNLGQNYPNPFNSKTEIQFVIPALSFVTLKVFDITGKQISCLVNEEKPAGTYEVTWQAGNLPGGVYFYQLNAGGLIETRKMILQH